MQQLLLELAPPPPPTLENFFAGRNGAALKALREALEDGERFVFLWGPGGSGKTHLLRAFSEAAAAAKREAAAIDDVGRLGEAERVALFDLCNRLRGSKGALAASGSAPPAQLALRADLRSRLASGIVLQLHPLSDADKAAALSAHAAGRGMALDRERKVIPLVYVQEPFMKRTISVPIPSISPLDPPLGLIPPLPPKTVQLNDTARLSFGEALLRGIAYAAQQGDAVTASGQLDITRYGHVLRSRRLVGVRGAGMPFDGLYYVTRVTHEITRGSYRQTFDLARNGLVSTLPRVPA